jgi:rare lipoprotein A (peptidoglycan hydrolase)
MKDHLRVSHCFASQTGDVERWLAIHGQVRGVGLGQFRSENTADQCAPAAFRRNQMLVEKGCRDVIKSLGTLDLSIGRHGPVGLLAALALAGCSSGQDAASVVAVRMTPAISERPQTVEVPAVGSQPPQPRSFASPLVAPASTPQGAPPQRLALAAPVGRSAGQSQPVLAAPGQQGSAIPYPPAQAPRTPGVYKIGKPYVVNGETYVPAEDPNYDQVGQASWYGDDFHGKSTANGETYDMNLLTAAHKTLPLPSYVHVTNLRNGRTIMVRVNNRGPFKPGRLVDLSRAAARALGFEQAGVTEVRVRYAGRAPIELDDTKERQYLATQVWSRSLRAPSGLGMSSAVAVAP